MKNFNSVERKRKIPSPLSYPAEITKKRQYFLDPAIVRNNIFNDLRCVDSNKVFFHLFQPLNIKLLHLYDLHCHVILSIPTSFHTQLVFGSISINIFIKKHKSSLILFLKMVLKKLSFIFVLLGRILKAWNTGIKR